MNCPGPAKHKNPTVIISVTAYTKENSTIQAVVIQMLYVHVLCYPASTRVSASLDSTVYLVSLETAEVFLFKIKF